MNLISAAHFNRPRPAVADPRLRKKLERLYALVRAKPSDPETRIALADALVPLNRKTLIFRHLRRAINDAPSAWGGLSLAGEILFRLGERQTAFRLLSKAHDTGCLNAKAYRTFSALLHDKGKTAMARRMLGISAFMQPITSPRTRKSHLPDVMRIRSFANSKYGIRKSKPNGLTTRSLQRGHFSLSDLLSSADINMWVINAFGDNLATIDRIPPVSLFINSVACPDLYASELGNIAQFLGRFPSINVINPPDRVLLTTRTGNMRRLPQIEGVQFPETAQIIRADSIEKTLAEIEERGIRLPFILREAGTQTGISMRKVETRKDARAYLEKQPPGRRLFAIQYEDIKDDAGHYRKTRAFFIDGTFFPVANLTNDDWQIHSGDRYRLMSSYRPAQERERDYLESPQEYLGDRAMQALYGIRDCIDLDFFGIDFCLLPDGGIFVFEANAAMRHNYDHAGNFPYTRPHLDRIGLAFSKMVQSRILA